VKQLPARRQTMLFSATMSSALHRLQALALKKPFVADLAPHEHLPSTLRQEYVFVPANVRDVYLVYLLRELAREGQSAIVFTSSCRSCETLAATLLALDIECMPLHSQQPQQRRLAAIGRLKQGSLRLLVATDVAARGIDIPAVGAVLQHNVPAMPREYVHRCGRTARAGREGRALTLVSQYDVELLLAIEKHVGAKLTPLEPDEAQVLRLMNEVASARRTALMQLTDNGFLEREKERRARRKEQREEGAEEEHDEEDEPGDGANSPTEAPESTAAADATTSRREAKTTQAKRTGKDSGASTSKRRRRTSRAAGE